jgi:hypothetical protein
MKHGARGLRGIAYGVCRSRIGLVLRHAFLPGWGAVIPCSQTYRKITGISQGFPANQAKLARIC